MSDVVMTYDPVAEAAATGLLMDERHRIIPECEWLRAVKRVSGRDDLFIYHHQETSNFVLAAWIYEKGPHSFGICLELEVMDIPPDRGGWIGLEYMKERLAPVDNMAKRMKRKLREARDDRLRENEDLAGQRDDIATHYHRKGRPEIAASISSSGYTRGEGCDRLTDMLKSAASTKIITHG